MSVDPERLLDKALDAALSLGANYVEANYREKSFERIVLKNDEIKVVESRRDRGLGIRAFAEGTLGFSSTNILAEGNVERAAEMSVRNAKLAASKGSSTTLSPSEPADVKYFVVERIGWEKVDLKDKVAFLRDLSGQIVAKGNDVRYPYRLFELKYVVERKILVNSEGAQIIAEIPRISLRYIITGLYKGRSLQRRAMIGGTGGWEILGRARIEEKISEEAAALSVILKQGRALTGGKFDLVVSPEVAGIIAHEAVGHPLEADRILGREAAQGGESYIKEHHAEISVGSELVNVFDDPTIPSSLGYYLYDDEGVRARRKELIRGGRVNEFLHSRETADKMGTKSNGSARAAGYESEPLVRMSNTFFERGDYSLEEMIEDVKMGVYMRSFTEWNIDDVRVNQRYVGLEAYLIEDGEIKEPILNPVLETTTMDLLSKLDAVGRDLEFVAAVCEKGDPVQRLPVWIGGPHLRFREVRVISR